MLRLIFLHYYNLLTFYCCFLFYCPSKVGLRLFVQKACFWWDIFFLSVERHKQSHALSGEPLCKLGSSLPLYLLPIMFMNGCSFPKKRYSPRLVSSSALEGKFITRTRLSSNTRKTAYLRILSIFRSSFTRESGNMWSFNCSGKPSGFW